MAGTYMDGVIYTDEAIVLLEESWGVSYPLYPNEWGLADQTISVYADIRDAEANAVDDYYAKIAYYKNGSGFPTYGWVNAIFGNRITALRNDSWSNAYINNNTYSVVLAEKDLATVNGYYVWWIPSGSEVAFLEGTAGSTKLHTLAISYYRHYTATSNTWRFPGSGDNNEFMDTGALGGTSPSSLDIKHGRG